ncbi:cytochrome P450 [Boletus edulis BED1]|uniref:Cytochrome P450 n=1 Tax=Boletus edulis BED1 TaxID=1328754 RepID=A0AAD4C6D7_BOLED|nr:cytochrome P450 [Boletus edulis BED1]
MFTNITWLDLCFAGVGLYLVKQVLTNKSPAPFPPGPKGLPLIGNIADMPSVKPWLTFTEWGRKYGDISHVEVLGQHIIILNNVKVAMEMLDKKSSSYSDRPVLPMGGELVGWKNTLVLLPYGDRFREYRKNFARVIGSRAAMDTYHPTEEIETHRFLQRVLAKPAELSQHVRHTAGAIILRISHGYEVKEHQDPFIDLADRAVDQFSMSTATGAFMVDVIPSLAYVPDWFPGASFKTKANEWRVTLEEMVQKPYQFVKDQMAAGIAPESFVSNLLEGRRLSAEEEHIVRWSSASLYSGILFLALTLFPDVQKKAQAEIDAVIGPDRLPNFTDRDSLPYVEALAKEVLRWNVVVPLAVPHRVAEDDVHDGYYIPKGTLVIPNVWFMLHDPRTYSEPNEFRPERFLARDGKEPETDPRSICFGLHLADASVWISVAMSLAAFDVSKIIENGVEVTPEIDPSSGTISHPKPFKCAIKPRSAKALELIQQDPVQ